MRSELKDATVTAADAAAGSATTAATNAGLTAADRIATAADVVAAAASAAASAASGQIYANTTAGLAAVAEGDFFNIVGAEYYSGIEVYRKIGGVAVLQKTLPSVPASFAQATVQALDAMLSLDNSGVALIADTAIPSLRIKDTKAPAKRFVGSITTKITTTRTTAGWYFDALGLLKQAATNVARFTCNFATQQPAGLLCEPARANRLLQNRSLRITHHLTVTAGAGVFADGETVNATGGGSGVYRVANSASSINALSGGAGAMTGTLTGATSGATKTISSAALVWAATNLTIAQDQVGLDGVANSASSITATAADAIILQAITIASATYFQTAYIKRLVGTGALYMTEDGGATWTDITPADTDWSRKSIPVQNLANPNVGLKIATSGDSFAIDCVQNENGSYETSPMLTTTAFFSRGSDLHSVTLSSLPFDVTLGSLFIEGRSKAPNSTQRTMAQIDDGTTTNTIVACLSSIGGAQLAITTASAVVANVLPGVAAVDKVCRVAASWGPNYAQAALDGTLGMQDNALTVPSGLATLRIGSGLAGTASFGGVISNLGLVLRTMDGTELTAVSNFGLPGSEPAIDIAPNDGRILDSDYAGTLTATAQQVSGVRPISFGNYQYANPGWRRRFRTRSRSLVLHFQNLNLVSGSYNGKGAIYADGVLKTYFTSPQAPGKFLVRLDFSSNADREIEIVMPHSAAIAHLGATTYGAPITAPTSRAALPRAAFLGDSRFQGFNATSIDKTWMEILCRAKGWQHINLGYGSSGVTSAWGTDLANANPDVAFVMFDHNNRSAQTSLLGFKNSYKTLITNFRAVKPTTKLYAVTSNWIGTAQDALPLKIANYRQATADALTEVADANNILIDGLTLTTNSTASIGDGIHPNDVGEAEWAADIAPLVSV